jgi:hypothetical protein
MITTNTSHEKILWNKDKKTLHNMQQYQIITVEPDELSSGNTDGQANAFGAEAHLRDEGREDGFVGEEAFAPAAAFCDSGY